MKNFKVKHLIMALIGVISMAAFAKETKTETITFKQIPTMDTTKVTTLVITKVKTLWYAWKGIFDSRMPHAKFNGNA